MFFNFHAVRHKAGSDSKIAKHAGYARAFKSIQILPFWTIRQWVKFGMSSRIESGKRVLATWHLLLYINKAAHSIIYFH